jgi:CBS domain-containing protein
MQTIRDIMTPSPVALEGFATISDAARSMRDNDIGDVLVLDKGHLFGIITDRDLVVRCIAENLPLTTKLLQVCTRSPVSATPNDPIDLAIRLMRENAVRRLPIVEFNRCVGIVSLGDLAAERDPDSVLANISDAQPTH